MSARMQEGARAGQLEGKPPSKNAPPQSPASMRRKRHGGKASGGRQVRAADLGGSARILRGYGMAPVRAARATWGIKHRMLEVSRRCCNG